MPIERIYIEPADRRAAMMDVIGAARSRLALSLFRLNDHGVLEALSSALNRGVTVEAILTSRAKGGKKPLEKLRKTLVTMGAQVHWYSGSVVKYHAKYMVADDRVALIATLNPTYKCFTRTWDFVYTTDDPELVRSVSTLFDIDTTGKRVVPRHGLSERLIIGPEGARPRLHRLIRGAQKSIWVLDHKLSDPGFLRLLSQQRNRGVDVAVIGDQPMAAKRAHGKLLILDDAHVVLGSTAMSSLSLDWRREMSVVIDARHIVRELRTFYADLRSRAGESISALPGEGR